MRSERRQRRWNLAHYGVDRYLKSWPVYLTNFGAGQSSLYAFLCAALFKLSGYSIRGVRIPAFLFSILTLVFGMKKYMEQGKLHHCNEKMMQLCAQEDELWL